METLIFLYNEHFFMHKHTILGAILNISYMYNINIDISIFHIIGTIK